MQYEKYHQRDNNDLSTKVIQLRLKVGFWVDNEYNIKYEHESSHYKSHTGPSHPLTFHLCMKSRAREMSVDWNSKIALLLNLVLSLSAGP